MRHATLIINPSAGKRQTVGRLNAAYALLKSHGFAVDQISTTGPGIATEIAYAAAAKSSQLIFACGGDGTVHEVLNGLMRWRIDHPNSAAPTLGIIPIGTANALARHLQLPLDALAAVERQLQFQPRLIPVGKILYESLTGPAHRYFLVMAGIGPDGMLTYNRIATNKLLFGRIAYYSAALRLYLTQRFPPFITEFQSTSSTNWHRQRSISAMTARISSLGGIFNRLTPAAKLMEPFQRLTLVTPPAKWTLPLWFVTAWLGLHRANPWLTSIVVDSFRCLPESNSDEDIHVQVDGDWLCRLPVEIKIIPNAIPLLMPPD